MIHFVLTILIQMTLEDGSFMQKVFDTEYATKAECIEHGEFAKRMEIGNMEVRYVCTKKENK